MRKEMCEYEELPKKIYNYLLSRVFPRFGRMLNEEETSLVIEKICSLYGWAEGEVVMILRNWERDSFHRIGFSDGCIWMKFGKVRMLR